jgi:glycosyltransferase involved in cell wall biosynthesis
MRISVVIPCHNAEPYLAQTIGSVLDQSRPSDEIIVVDDGSTDGSLALARRFEAEGVRVLSSASLSAARTRNFGASIATGDALMFLDADDVLGPHALAALLQALSSSPDGIAACPWYRLECVNGRWMSRPPSCPPRGRGQDVLSAWLMGWYYPTCSILWSRAAYEATGGWDPQARVNQDGDLMMRALVCSRPLVETSAGSGYYRRLEAGKVSLSGTRSTPAGLRSRLDMLLKVAAQLENLGAVDRYRISLGKAFLLIAADAHAHPDLHSAAERYARQYTASPAARAAMHWHRTQRKRLQFRNRVRRLLGRARSRADVVKSGLEEVRYGIDRAERVLRGEPSEPR